MSLISPCQKLQHPLFEQNKITVFIKRDDLIHPIISGNKWRKLKYNVIAAKDGKYQGILSFGGAYSNHLHALAFACQEVGLKSLAIVRGEAENAGNTTLTQAQAWGMQLHFVDRQTYRRRTDTDYLNELQKQYPNYYIVPEGGSNSLALPGVSEVMDELNQQVQFDTLLCPVGSGGTLAGLICAAEYQQRILGIAVLKQAEYLKTEIKNLLGQQPQNNHWELLTQCHRGGYAKFSSADYQEILSLSQHFNIAFEPVYSGKMLLAFFDLVKAGYFQPNERVVLLHTGGLQGLNGLFEQNKISQFPNGFKAIL